MGGGRRQAQNPTFLIGRETFTRRLASNRRHLAANPPLNPSSSERRHCQAVISVLRSFSWRRAQVRRGLRLGEAVAMKRFGLQALFATAMLLASLAPAVAAHASASSVAFRPVRLDRSGSVLVRSLPTRAAATTPFAKPFLRTPPNRLAGNAQRSTGNPVGVVMAAVACESPVERARASAWPKMSRAASYSP